MKHTTEIFIQS